MSPEEQQISIAESVGWKIDPEPEDGALMGTLNGNWDMIPDYPHDLNAMHEAEKTLSEEDADMFQQYLDVLFLQEELTCPASGYYFHATAAQRAEAFLRAKGLWKETPDLCPKN